MPSNVHAFVTPAPNCPESHLPIHRHYLQDEPSSIRQCLQWLKDHPAETIQHQAAMLVEQVRAQTDALSPLDAFMQEYDLSSEEGVMLMCIAESLLRIPDADTADALIQDKLGSARWEAHLGQSESLWVNASTWGLMLTGRLMQPPEHSGNSLRRHLTRLIARTGEPVVRLAIRQAMKIMAHQFVMGRTIEEALRRSRSREARRYLHSFDMLGEAAITHADALRYARAYHHAIESIAHHTDRDQPLAERPGISIKLSALHPRYEYSQRALVLRQLGDTLAKLVDHARQHNVPVTIDAEEADRLALSLELFEPLYRHTAAHGWAGLGLAVQAYQKRALPVLEWLLVLAREHRCVIPVRLVKGAYWDSEIKRAQELGLDGYPVYTRKINTDVAYLACARFLLQNRDGFYPQFATHNAHTIAAIRHYAGDGKGYEFQRLHGMGQLLYDTVIDTARRDVTCRVYAPVGSHEDLLPYLVRRLLENGANSSFVNRVVDADLPVDAVVQDPVQAVQALDTIPNPAIPLPQALYGDARRNSRGIHWADPVVRNHWQHRLEALSNTPASAGPVTPCEQTAAETWTVTSPVDGRVIGHWQTTDPQAIDRCIQLAGKAQPAWDRTGWQARAGILDRMADLLEQHTTELLHLCCREAGKTLPDATNEVREAVDFCRYYAAEARRLAQPMPLPGPTGESNRLSLHGRGVFVCISPWNFPLAIFTGQIAAALVGGNGVVAKPAEQTTLIAARAVNLFHQAGVPREILQLLPGSGRDIGDRLTRHPLIAGVAFTGSTHTAHAIQRNLAQREGPIATLIAETGGQNAMLVDSSALPEQVVRDVLQSAFSSTGQRCSALRVLFLQQEIAPRVLELLHGAMQCLRGGDPAMLHHDYGPVIDSGALERLQDHIRRMHQEARLIARAPEPDGPGFYLAPHAFELKSISTLREEVFGPILHVIRYRAEQLDAVIDAINQTGYGLTMGIHSRIESRYHYIHSRCQVGNCYVNRNMIGAVVGVQPFGGEGLSGTGPKAGGPHYLHRFTTERTLTVNTAAIGGNATLLSQSS